MTCKNNIGKNIYKCDQQPQQISLDMRIFLPYDKKISQYLKVKSKKSVKTGKSLLTNCRNPWPKSQMFLCEHVVNYSFTTLSKSQLDFQIEFFRNFFLKLINSAYET